MTTSHFQLVGHLVKAKHVLKISVCGMAKSFANGLTKLLGMSPGTGLFDFL